MSKLKFQTPTGMRDVLPEDWPYFQRIYDVARNIMQFYGFGHIETPILEEEELFSRGVGLSTDIVQKEMYALKTKGGDFLALRPEGTAPVMRAYLEHGMQSLVQPVKLWYFGPFFRYEKPQAGRYRQFWQFGLEILGESAPVIDVQVIEIVYNILRELRLKNLIVEVNSIGDKNCRPHYKRLLVRYLKPRISGLGAECQRKLKENPLRILDSKDEKCRRIVSQAPQIIDYLCDECHQHFKETLEFLEATSIPYRLNPYLVRGLDYYTRTVFEVFEEREDGNKNALAGGGRYDLLSEVMGGEDVPAAGAALGVERVIDLMKEKEIGVREEKKARVFLAQLGVSAKRKSLEIIEMFRKARIPLAESLAKDSLRSQLTLADKLGVNFTLILGQREVLEGTIIVRSMKNGEQKTIKIEKVVDFLKKKLKK